MSFSYTARNAKLRTTSHRPHSPSQAYEWIIQIHDEVQRVLSALVDTVAYSTECSGRAKRGWWITGHKQETVFFLQCKRLPRAYGNSTVIKSTCIKRENKDSE